MSKEKFLLMLKIIFVILIIIFIGSIISGNTKMVSKSLVIVATYIVAIKKLSK